MYVCLSAYYFFFQLECEFLGFRKSSYISSCDLGLYSHSHNQFGNIKSCGGGDKGGGGDENK